jgi:hypothetical protein
MRQHRITRSAVLALALAAFTAPAAAAPLDLRDPGSSVAFPAPPASASQDLRNPDSRVPALVEASASQDLRAPDTIDAASGRGTFNAPEVTVVKVPGPPAPASSSRGGLDWADAGIGAGGILAVVLVALGATIAVLHRKHGGSIRRQTATTV